MGLVHGKVIKVGADGEAIRSAVVEAMTVEAAGLTVTLADTDAYATGVAEATGILTVTNVTDEHSAMFTLHMEAGVVTIGSLVAHSSFSTTVDTASKVNVYVDAGEVKVQNVLGGDRTIKIAAHF